jgi:ATP-dependent protease ClpP protease subunit
VSKPIQFIRASKNEEGTHLWVTGEIGVDVRFADLQRALSHYAEENTGDITLNIYSHGGYLDDATAFYDWIADSGTRFKVRIWGTAMSAATVIAAAAGRDNIEIAANATWMIHETQGGTDEMRAIGNDSLVRVYRKLTGMKEAKIREMIAATTTLNASDAVAMGFAGKVMKSTARLAAMYEAKPIELNEQPTAMAETKTKVPVKLNLKEAWASLSANGTEVEVDIDAATADTIAEKDTRIAQLETELAEAKAKTVDEAAHAEALNKATQEAVTAKADLATAAQKHMDELKAKDEAHAKVLADLKAPLAGKTVADNQAAAVAAMPGAVQSESDKAAKAFATKAHNALERGMSEAKAAKAAVK